MVSQRVRKRDWEPKRDESRERERERERESDGVMGIPWIWVVFCHFLLFFIFLTIKNYSNDKREMSKR